MMVNLANTFYSRGIKTDLVLVRKEGPYVDDVEQGIEIVELNASRVSTSLLSLAKYLRRVQPTAILSTLMYANVVVACAHFIAKSQARLVLREANAITAACDRRRTAKGKIIHVCAGWAYKYCDRVVGISEGLTEDIKNVYGLPDDRVITIYNPVVNDDVVARAKSDGSGSDVHTSFILGVGRLVEQKDFATLISAFARVKKTHNVRLIILGEGDQREELKTLVEQLELEGCVSMPGFVDDPYSYMKAASVFVLSSRWEGFGNVLVEALACGAPVVSTDCPSGPSEILEEGRWGELVPVGDATKMASAICQTLDATEHPVASQRALSFHVDKIAEKYMDVLLG